VQQLLVFAALFVSLAACSGDGGTFAVPVIPAPSPPDTTPPSPPPTPPPPTPSPPAPAPGDPLAGGIVAVFRNQGTGTDGLPFDETFRVWITNPQTIDDVFEVQAGINPTRFPAGTLLAGPGEADHNLPWSWHLDPDNVAMVEAAMEACDGRPSLVEQYLANFLNVGSYCPWSASLDSIEDYR
jgi:hypothetical protein